MSHERIDIHITKHRVEDSSQTHIANITDLVAGNFNWTIQAQGGFATATLTLVCDDVFAYQLLDEHLGRRIVFTNPLSPDSDYICWEGRIFNVTVDDGRISTRRSMQDVFNSVRVSYVSAQLVGDILIPGSDTITASNSLTASILRYGIRELVFSTGLIADDSAIYYRDRLLNDYAAARPVRDNTAVGGASGTGNIVKLDCIGWYETLAQRFYTYTADSDLTSTTNIIKAVLTGVGQFINSDQTNVNESNAMFDYRYQDQVMTAADYINHLSALGTDTGSRRCYFGVYENAKGSFFAEPTTTKYIIQRLDTRERVVDATTGIEVAPWLVRPGQIAFTPDMLPDALNYSSVLDDLRKFVIGEVKFTAPDQIQLTPADNDPGQLSLQRLAWLERYNTFRYLRYQPVE